MNVFERISEAVDIVQAAKYYGIDVARGNKAHCPFHGADKHPSMSFKNNRYKCFACGAGGDAINLVRNIYGIQPADAAKRLNEDFHLGLPLDKPIDHAEVNRAKRTAERKRAFDEWEQNAFITLSAYIKLLRRNREKYKPQNMCSDWHPLFVEALQEMEHIDYLLDILNFGTFEDKLNFYVNNRNEVKAIAERIRTDRHTTQ